MDKKSVFVKTSKGESEVNGSSDALYGDAKRILLLVDDDSTVNDITKRAPPSLRNTINEVLQELLDGAYIRDENAEETVPQKSTLKFSTPGFKMAAPKAAPVAKPSPPPNTRQQNEQPAAKPVISSPPAKSIPSNQSKPEPAKPSGNGDLDFSFITGSAPQSKPPSAPAVRPETDSASRSKQDAERLKAEQLAQIEATAKASKLKAYEEAKMKARIEVEAKARVEAEIRLKKETELARNKVEQDAIRTRQELEATKARVEAEVRVRIEAEVRMKQEAEAARLKAAREAEKTRLELEAAKAKAEQEIRFRLEAEARARAEIEARLKREAEADRLRLAKERAELEIARVKAEAEIKMRAETELRVRAEIEARVQAEALAQQRQLLGTSKGTLGSLPQKPAKNEDVDPAEKLRQSFVESFGQNKKKSDPGSTTNFKLEKFSLINTSKMAALVVEPKKTTTLPGAGSKVKAAIELRAKKEAEAKRIMAEQEAARIQQEQSKVVVSQADKESAAKRLQKEQETLRLRAEQEAYRKKIEHDAAQIKVDDEAQILEKQQSRQWDEAQRKAEQRAHGEQENMPHSVAEMKPHKAARIPRKPLPIGKILVGLVVMFVLVVLALPYVISVDEYTASVEQEISAQINQPVKIQKMHFSLLPLPRLDIRGLAVGKLQEFKVSDAALTFDLTALFASTRSINKLELNNIQIAAASLDKAIVWMQAAGGIEKYPVALMEFKQIEVKSPLVKLPLLSGRANFDAQGKFIKANLKSADSKYSIDLENIQNHLQMEINITESSLPIYQDIKFKKFSAIGIVENGEIAFSDIFANIYGGNFKGKGALSWNNGWKLQGQIKANSLELASMFPLFSISGQLYGDVLLTMVGSTLALMDNDPRIEGSFEAKNGEIGKLDIDTVARFGSRPGTFNRTAYTEISGNLKTDLRGQHLIVNKIDAGVVTGSGLVEIDAKDRLSGKLMIDVKGLASNDIQLQLSGTPTEPVLQQWR